MSSPHSMKTGRRAASAASLGTPEVGHLRQRRGGADPVVAADERQGAGTGAVDHDVGAHGGLAVEVALDVDPHRPASGRQAGDAGPGAHLEAARLDQRAQACAGRQHAGLGLEQCRRAHRHPGEPRWPRPPP